MIWSGGPRYMLIQQSQSISQVCFVDMFCNQWAAWNQVALLITCKIRLLSIYIMSTNIEWLKSRSSCRVNLNLPGECLYFWQKEQNLVSLSRACLVISWPEHSNSLCSFL